MRPMTPSWPAAAIPPQRRRRAGTCISRRRPRAGMWGSWSAGATAPTGPSGGRRSSWGNGCDGARGGRSLQIGGPVGGDGVPLQDDLVALLRLEAVDDQDRSFLELDRVVPVPVRVKGADQAPHIGDVPVV